MTRWLNSLRFRICLLVALGVIPIGILVYHDYRELSGLTHSLVQEKAFLTAGQVSMGIDLLAETTRQLLTSVAQDPAVKNLDLPPCRRMIEGCYGKQPFLFYTNLGMTDQEGNVICSAIPHKEKINVSDRSYFQQAIKTRDFAIGGFQAEQITDKSILSFGQPVLDDKGHVGSMLFADMDLSWFNRIIAAADLPEGTVLTVIDQHGMVLSRNLDAQKWIGKVAPDSEIVQACFSKHQGTVEAKGIDGIPKLYGFRPLGHFPGAGYVYVGVPKENISAGSRQLLISHVTWLLIAFGLGLSAIWFFGFVFLTRKMTSVINTSKILAAGDLSARTGFTNSDGEIGELGLGFDRMAEALEQRDAKQKETSASLLREKQFSDTLIESLPGIFYSFDQNGSMVRWNGLMEKLSGYSREEISGMRFTEFVVEEDRPNLEEAIRQVFEMGISSLEVLFVTEDQNKIPLLITGKRMEEDGRGLLVGMGLDITARKQSEKLLLKSEQKYRSLFEDSRDGIFMVRRDGKVIDANQSFLDIFGYSRQEIVGNNILLLYADPEDRPKFQEEVERADSVKDYAIRFKNKDGMNIECMLTSTVARDHEGKVIGYQGIVRDVTAQKQTEGALKFEREQLLSIFDSINQIIYVMDPVTYEVLYANSYAREIFGQDIVGGLCYERLHGLESPCEWCPNNKVLQLHGQPYEWEFHIVNSATDLVIIDRVIRWPDGRDVKFEFAMDITERKRAEKALRESEEHSRFLADVIENGAQPFGIGYPDGTPWICQQGLLRFDRL